MIRSFQGILPTIGRGAYVDEAAQVIGDVTLGEDSSVWPLTTVRGDVNRIVIGARSNIQDNSCLHVVHERAGVHEGVALLIGDDVTVGHGVILHACTIGHRCLIGMGAIVLDKAVLEDECFIAAGAVVSPGKTLKGGWLYRGSPAQPVRELTATERENLKYSAAHYVRLKNKYQAA